VNPAEGGSAELAALEHRMRRLEVVDEVRDAFHRYFYCVDAGRVDELLDLFTADVAWSAVDMPPGSGTTVSCSGRAEVRPVLEALPHGTYRHFGTHLVVEPGAGADTASTVAYMAVIVQRGGPAAQLELTGGLYEGRWRRESSRWRIAEWRVVGQWFAGGPCAHSVFVGLEQGAHSARSPLRGDTTSDTRTTSARA